MAHHADATTPFYALMAEFDSADALLSAATAVGKAGFTKTDAYSPFPIHGLAEAIGFHEKKVAPIVLAGGVLGMLGGYGLEYWTQVIAYPMNIGGRPIHSWPAFIVPTFETTILFAAGTAVLGMLALNGLPEPYHPVFNVPQFARASKDRFFIVIEARDPKFDLDATWSFLTSLKPRSVSEVDQ